MCKNGQSRKVHLIARTLNQGSNIITECQSYIKFSHPSKAEPEIVCAIGKNEAQIRIAGAHDTDVD